MTSRGRSGRFQTELQSIGNWLLGIMNDKRPRELWQPSHDEQMAALEVLLASDIPTELRRELRARELELSRRTA